MEAFVHERAVYCEQFGREFGFGDQYFKVFRVEVTRAGERVAVAEAGAGFSQSDELAHYVVEQVVFHPFEYIRHIEFIEAFGAEFLEHVG